MKYVLVPSYINSIMSLHMYIPDFFQLSFHYSTCKAASAFPHCLFVQPQKAFPAGKSVGTLMFTVTIFHFKRM